ncbi:uncharacterized protein LOC111714564 [Eurytemora carolleeae]|uniref:uncharacterized protein LOC111714564 n=1 Tax=Eurytemora carolleeae TaxID=1294199 RepID=UPI000C7574B1|nr:uncharacterized protein LOC111714564 [Eurytemora carolleeae]|eukprot:XP_023345469.1 uncharacterized protein LOC111714564 [Eurytemora affinis]
MSDEDEVSPRTLAAAAFRKLSQSYFIRQFSDSSLSSPRSISQLTSGPQSPVVFSYENSPLWPLCVPVTPPLYTWTRAGALKRRTIRTVFDHKETAEPLKALEHFQHGRPPF